jgi:glycosyltransferase involved in cell wall biosynthesis
MRVPRVAVCISNFEYGGQGRVVEEELLHLREDFDLVLAARKVSRTVPDGVGVYAGRDGLLEQLKSVDVIHCHDSYAYMKEARKSLRPWVVTSHGICPSRYRNSLPSAAAGLATQHLYPKLYSSATVVVAISEYVGDRIRRSTGISPVVISHGAGTAMDSIAGRPGRKALLYVGEVSIRKGIDLLLDCVASCGDDVSLDLIGSGSTDRARRYAEKLGVSGRVRIHGEVTDAILEKMYESAFAVCSASRWEGFGLPLMEGFRYGRPVLARGVSGMKEIVAKSGAGCTFSTREEFVLKLDEIDASWSMMSAAARDYASKHSWDAVFSRYSNLFHALSS